MLHQRVPSEHITWKCRSNRATWRSGEKGPFQAPGVPPPPCDVFVSVYIVLHTTRTFNGLTPSMTLSYNVLQWMVGVPPPSDPRHCPQVGRSRTGHLHRHPLCSIHSLKLIGPASFSSGSAPVHAASLGPKAEGDSQDRKSGDGQGRFVGGLLPSCERRAT